tara:strand:+ start:4779 stop:5756 length:978 start_codon:yes stop_codon:yes gene_type:complete
MKRAFITGITGQDGSYLCDLLLSKGYQVFGLTRSLNTIHKGNLAHLVPYPGSFVKNLKIVEGSFYDPRFLEYIVQEAQPDEVYHLAAQSHPQTSFNQPEQALDINTRFTVRLLEINRHLKKTARFFFASTSQIFGKASGEMQDEKTAMHPVSPYAASKACANQMVTIYREIYKLPCCSGIFYNHESPRRSNAFLSKKLAQGVALIKHGKKKRLALGDLTPSRDWGWAPDYVHGMWSALQQDTFEDYIFATGQAHTVEDFVRNAFAAADLDWKEYVDYDEHYTSPSEPTNPCGNPAKAKEKLGWKHTLSFEEMVQKLVEYELERLA